MTLDCPAKVNLALSVGRPRADGYHPIASLMTAVTFADRLTLTALSTGETSRLLRSFIEVDQPIDWPVEKDLAWRAHALLAQHVGQPLACEMEVRKRIPAGAGLGGGSSNAAAVLVGLNRLFDLQLDRATLVKLGLSLGSDVGFAVYALTGHTAALVTGFGDQLQPLNLPGVLHLVLVFPPFGCPTGPVYQAFDRLSPEAVVDEPRVRALAQQRGIEPGDPFNDLAAPACVVQPELGEIQQRLTCELKRPVHVTGSGSTLFFLAPDESTAGALARNAMDLTGLRAVATRTH